MVGDRRDGSFLSFVDRDTHPTLPRCRGYVALVACCVFCAFGSVAQWEHFGSVLVLVRRLLALQALFLLRLRLPLSRKLLREFRFLGLLLLLLPSL